MAQRGVNKVILVGNIGQDPEVRYMPNGNAVASLSLATSETWKDKNTGQEQSKTEWHRIVFFNRLAEVVGEYVKKGAKLYVEGSLRTRSWEQDGITRYATEIVASEMQMLGSNPASGDDDQQYDGHRETQQQTRQAPPQQQRTSASRPAQHTNRTANIDNFDDDIPF